jgi:hypothetical protein
MTYLIGTTTIGNRDFIPVAGLVHLAIAICFLYAGTTKLFVRTTDKVLYLLIEELVNRDAAISHQAKLTGLQEVSLRKQAAHRMTDKPNNRISNHSPTAVHRRT